MKTTLPYLLLFILNCIFITSITCQSNEWQLEKEGSNIKIYTRLQSNSKFKAFKAITTSKNTISYFEKLILDVKNHKKWQENVHTAKILSEINENEMYIYYTTNLPWPLKSRDIIYHVKKTILIDNTIRFEYTCKPKHMAENDDYLRLAVSNGSWEFIPLKNDKVKIIYQFHGDPGGSIPTWILNIFLVKGPYKTLQNIR